MKKILLVISLVIYFVFGADDSNNQVNAAEFNGLTQVGSFMTDGGSSKLGIVVGGDIIIKSLKGFVIKERITQLSVRGVSPGIQGQFVLNVLQLTLAESWWNLYIAQKTGVFNKTLQGDDEISGVLGLELGCTLFNKPLDFCIGADLIPVKDKGDNIFVYAGLNFKL